MHIIHTIPTLFYHSLKNLSRFQRRKIKKHPSRGEYVSLKRFSLIGKPLFCYNLISRIFDVRLCCGKSCDRHTVRRAGYVTQTDCVAELNGRRVATVFTANTTVHFRTCLSTVFNCHFHKLTNTRRV